MNRAMVESTTLLSLAYDEARELLELEFHGGSIYQYFGVPTAVHEALRKASSKGSSFNQSIRGRFPYALSTIAQGNQARRA
jgi:KTSC domain